MARSKAISDFDITGETKEKGKPGRRPNFGKAEYSRMQKGELVRVMLALPPDLKARLKAKVVIEKVKDNDVTISTVVTNILNDYFEKNPISL